jgi:neutral ceramidase
LVRMARLKVGAGRAQIKFIQEMLPTEGFDGIHDLPYVGIVVMECGERAAIASIDLVMLPDDIINEYRKTIGRIANVDPANVWVHVTHAISTPHEPGPSGPPDKRPPLTERHKEQIAMFRSAISAAVEEAANRAATSIVPARMGAGSTQCMLNRNRDVEFEAGWWINIGDGPSDHSLRCIRFDDMEGNPVAIILNYDMKPCTIDNSEMQAGTRKICADVPGIACANLTDKFGGPVIYIMGAAGDQVPRDMAMLEEAGSEGNAVIIDKGVAYGLELVRKFAAEFEADAERVISETVCDKDEVPIQFASGNFTWPGKNSGKTVPQRSLVMEPGKEVKLDVFVLAIGDVALVGFKPEINYATSMQLKEASPFETTLLCSMINGGFKYMPDQSSYDRATWEAQRAGLMPGAAEKFVEVAAGILKNI